MSDPMSFEDYRAELSVIMDDADLLPSGLEGLGHLTMSDLDSLMVAEIRALTEEYIGRAIEPSMLRPDLTIQQLLLFAGDVGAPGE